MTTGNGEVADEALADEAVEELHLEGEVFADQDWLCVHPLCGDRAIPSFSYYLPTDLGPMHLVCATKAVPLPITVTVVQPEPPVVEETPVEA